MAFVTGHALVAAVQRKLGLAVVEVRGLPALGSVAARTIGLPLLASELLAMDIRMACFANQRRAFEHDFLLAHRRFMTIIASNGSMHAKQGEFGFRVVESRHPTHDLVLWQASQPNLVPSGR